MIDSYCEGGWSISIHASARDATNKDRGAGSAKGFQSTHPRGMRLGRDPRGLPHRRFQSTHPRGMRPNKHRCRNNMDYFNPRIREGCDIRFCIAVLANLYFNPRIREGCDGDVPIPLPMRAHFNPRIREGCDTSHISCDHFSSDFNPRIREGCDATKIAVLDRQKDFNPRIREGCDCARLSPTLPCWISIHASARDATSS